MANIKSAKLRIKKTKTKTENNNFWKRKVNKALKELNKAQDKKAKFDAFGQLSSALDKAAKHGVIHKNKARRTKSRFSKVL